MILMAALMSRSRSNPQQEQRCIRSAKVSFSLRPQARIANSQGHTHGRVAAGQLVQAGLGRSRGLLGVRAGMAQNKHRLPLAGALGGLPAFPLVLPVASTDRYCSLSASVAR